MPVDKGAGQDHGVSVELGRGIKAARGKMKQDELARLIGTDQPTISKWERGAVRPSIESILAIEKATGRPSGFVFIVAGLVELPATTRASIETDDRLNDDGRRSVLAVYEAMAR